jgi:murein DD-endopeptidase MepM/ murein hydrolase activator NlpD
LTNISCLCYFKYVKVESVQNYYIDSMGLKEKTQLTIVFIPHHGGKTISLSVPQWVVMCLLGFGAFLLVGLGLVTTGYINKFVDVSMLQKFQVENRILRSRLDDFSAKSLVLEKQITGFVNFDSKIRMMSGLQGIDPDIRRVGVGGDYQEVIPGEVSHRTAGSIREVGEDLSKLVREAKLQEESFQELSTVLNQRQEKWDHMPSIQPAPGWIISEYGCRRDPMTGEMRMHEGIDIASPNGTIIVASADGCVSYAGPRGNYGLCIEIDHGFGVVTRYAHCSLIKTRQGSTVKRGQVIALVGETGRATGPHLHYEVLINGTTTEPTNYILAARMF